MGMFDSVELKTPIPCPKCKQDLKEFQTKELGSFLDVYKEGKVKSRIVHLRASEYHYKMHPKNTAFIAYDYCEKCDKMIYQDFKFDKKGKLKRQGKPDISKWTKYTNFLSMY